MHNISNNSRIRELSKHNTQNQRICQADKSIVYLGKSGDRGVDLHEAIPKITIQLRQCTNFVQDVESIKRSVVSGRCNKRLFSNGKKCLSNRSKLKHSECSESETVPILEHGDIVEIDSLSSSDANIRLQSNESSSEIQVSENSMQDKPTQLRQKNIIPADSFEKYLYTILRAHKELTYRDKIVSWQCSEDVSDVEDYSHFEERLRKQKINYDFTKTGKVIMDNNNRLTSLKKTNSRNGSIEVPSKCSSRKNMISDNPAGNNRRSENNTDHFKDYEKKDFVMSFNTQTMEIWKPEKILLNADQNSVDPSPDLLRHDTSDVALQRCRRNSEIEKISQLVHSRLLKKCKSERQKKFKIPITPVKCESGKMDVKQKEEFYKYLGLETNTANQICTDLIQHDNTSRTETMLLKDDVNGSSFNRQGQDLSRSADLKDHQMLSSMHSTRNENDDEIISELGIHNTTDLKSSQMVANFRRNCGTVINSNFMSCSDNIWKPNNTNQYYCNRTKMFPTNKVKPTESSNTLILLRHTYKKPFCHHSTIVQPFCENMSLDQNEEVNNINSTVDNVEKKLPSIKKFRQLNSSKNSSLSCEKPFASKFKAVQHQLKANAVRLPSCILERLDYRSQCTNKYSKPLTSITCSNVFENLEEDTTNFRSHSKVKIRRKLISGNRRRILNKSQHVKILRSSILNRRILRSGKYFIISAKTLKKRSRSKILKKRKRVKSEISENILSPACAALMDPIANDVVVMAPELKVEETNLSTENDIPPDKDASITKVEYASPNLPPNPLQSEKGKVLHAFYVQDILIVVQELFVSFWKYSKVIQMLGKPQEWEQLGECQRQLNDFEVIALYKNRICLNDANPVYIEMRAKLIEPNCARECNLTSVYINVYYFDEWKVSPVTYSVQLDTVRGLESDITFTTITNSRYFVMCWKQGNLQGEIRTGLCKYALTPTLDTLASIREFKQMRHVINYLECINDYKLIGFGETQVTIWDHRTGDVLTNFDLGLKLGRNVGSVISSVQFKSYLFLYQTRYVESSKTPELKILAITLSESNPSFRLICTHELPSSFSVIHSSIYTEKQVITTSLSGEEFLLLTHQPHCLYYFNSPLSRKLTRFHANGGESFVEISDDMLTIKSLDEYLMNFAR